MLEIKENETQKALFIDGVCQGVVSKDGTPLSPYMKPIMERIAGLNKGSELLFLGGGLYALPAHYKAHHSISVVELSKEVMKAAGLKDDDIRTPDGCMPLGKVVDNILGDALDVIKGLEYDWFDFILLDIWPNDPKLYCADYFVECKRHLKKGGLFSMNYQSEDDFELKAMGKLLAAVFPNVKMTTLYKDKEMKIPCQAVYFGN